MFEQGLIALLTADAGVSGLVATRIFPVQGPPDNPTYPYITYQNVSGSSDYAFDEAEIRTVRVQFDIWGTGYLVNKSIIRALRNLLTGDVGTLTDGTRVLFCSRLNEMDNFDNDSKAYRSIAEYEFEISEGDLFDSESGLFDGHAGTIDYQ